jgi:hypothetical protein
MLEKNAEIFWKSMNSGAEPDSVTLTESIDDDSKMLFEIVHKNLKSYIIGEVTSKGFMWRFVDEDESLMSTDIVDKSNERESTG